MRCTGPAERAQQNTLLLSFLSMTAMRFGLTWHFSGLRDFLCVEEDGSEKGELRRPVFPQIQGAPIVQDCQLHQQLRL